ATSTEEARTFLSMPRERSVGSYGLEECGGTRSQAGSTETFQAADAAYTLGLAMPYFPRLCSSSPASRKRKYRIQVPVDDVEFSQESIGERFTCGRKLQKTVDDLFDGKADYCRNNRRLWCWKEYQKLRRQEDKDFTVKVRLDA
ncbi:unnamed protein product, partial [Symbiodinium microadriaticum]